jgi:hypothetical protein
MTLYIQEMQLSIVADIHQRWKGRIDKMATKKKAAKKAAKKKK